MIQIIDVKENQNINEFNDAAKKAHDNPDTHGLLVKIYADWCGHCRNMKKDWDKLVNELKTQYQCKKPGCILTIANIEAVNLEPSDPVLQNLKHIPKDIQSIPTIMYVSKGMRGLEYSNNRVYSDMINWIIGHKDFALVRKSKHHKHSSKGLRGITKKARIKFQKFHRNTLKQFHEEMRRHKKSIKTRMRPTPAAAIHSSQLQQSQQQQQKYIPGYLRE